MELRFITQQVPESISSLDVVELVNCERGDGFMNGEYTVGQVDPDSGDVMLVGMGELSGHIANINLGNE